MRRIAIIGAAIVALSAIGFAVLAQSESDDDLVEGLSFLGEPVTVADIAAGETLYAENCASCHGAELEGQPDWRSRLPNGRLPAPPHDASGHTWHHTDRVLLDIVKRGTAAIVGNGYESDMPGFKEVLTDEEITAIIDYIKSTWPDRIRASQESRTLADEQVQP